jgi:glycosyltransferase involved in cell wall biosynthesis
LCLLHHVHADQWQKYFPGPVAAAARAIERRSLPLVYRGTHFLTISPSTAGELVELGIDASRVHLVFLGVDDGLSQLTSERSSKPLFVALGRLAPNKRLDLLLDLWARVGPKTGGTLMIVGDGPERERIAERVRTEPGLRDVIVEGRVTDERKAALLGEAWLIVHTAEREGWGLVLIEAGLCGTPTLAYRVPGVVDAVVDGETGVLVDDDDAFVDAWVSLAEDPARVAELGAAARTRAATFTWERSVDAFLAAGNAAIAEHAGAGNARAHGD